MSKKIRTWSEMFTILINLVKALKGFMLVLGKGAERKSKKQEEVGDLLHSPLL